MLKITLWYVQEGIKNIKIVREQHTEYYLTYLTYLGVKKSPFL